MMPGIPDVPGSPRPPAPSLGSLMGPQSASQPQMMAPNAANQGVMQQVAAVTQSLDALAQQFPENPGPLQQAKQLLVSWMVSTVGQQPAPESPAPNVLG